MQHGPGHDGELKPAAMLGPSTKPRRRIMTIDIRVLEDSETDPTCGGTITLTSCQLIRSVAMQACDAASKDACKLLRFPDPGVPL